MLKTTTECFCDVCGKPATYPIRWMTGRAILDGRDIGQDVDLCDEHRPADDYQWQPRNTDRLIFHWPGKTWADNLYPPR